MIQARFVPIEQWPGERTKNRRRSTFGAKYQRTLDDLERELAHLGARNIVIQAFLRGDDIRNDGWPRSNARFQGPGIVLSFQDRSGQALSFPCDTFLNWDCNLRAITLTLTALRAIDRYGVTKRAEQYSGWKKLAAPAHEQKHDAEWALNHLATLAGVSIQAIKGNSAALDLAYRAAARKTHPDSGGNTEAFQLLQEAIRLLRMAA